MQTKAEDIWYNDFTISLVGTNHQSNPVCIVFKVTKEGTEDSFEMIIPLEEAMARHNTTHEEYVEKSIEAIKHYLDLCGIMGNQTHVFIFVSSNFVPKEPMAWP